MGHPKASRAALQDFTELRQSLSRALHYGAGIDVWQGGVRMKRWIGILSVALLLVIAGVVMVRADEGGWRGWHHRGWAFGGGPLGIVGHALNLSDAQRAQVKTSWEGERPVVAPLLKELADESREMDAATAKGTVDDERVREIAGRQGQTVAKLLVEKERFRAKVYNGVLNDEQRAKADAFAKKWHERLEGMANRMSGADLHP
ncbi:periplasmic heavy metal sensor [Acidobacteria bacterium AB60]|nr:periplasmic heavy metal sensor [Acidobacteria bacterium AB60]